MRTVLRELAIIAALGVTLAGASVGLLHLEFGSVHLGMADLATALAVGIVAASVIRGTVRLHRRWRPVVGRFTAAAALSAIAAAAGFLIAFAPPDCPGGVLHGGRCSVSEAAAWGQVAGLATVLNFIVAGLVLAIFRTAWSVLRDGSTQGIAWIAALRKRLRRPEPPRPGSKGRPTPRRAEAERARRERLRARA